MLNLSGILFAIGSMVVPESSGMRRIFDLHSSRLQLISSVYSGRRSAAAVAATDSVYMFGGNAVGRSSSLFAYSSKFCIVPILVTDYSCVVAL